MRTILVLITLLVTMFTRRVEAAPMIMRFGIDEHVNKIQDVPLKGPNNEDLYLGHLISIVCIVAGVCLIDKGYVLGIKGGVERKYFPLTEETIKSLQSTKMLPSPLPKYNISLVDYIFGYFLWVIIVGALAYVALLLFFERRKAYRVYFERKNPNAYKTNTAQKIIATKEMQEYFLRNFPPTKPSPLKKR